MKNMKKAECNGYIRIEKRTAKKLFNLGCDIVLTPSKCRPTWLVSYAINYNCDYFDFEKWVNNFKLYNCISELGKNVQYYIEKSDVD